MSVSGDIPVSTSGRPLSPWKTFIPTRARPTVLLTGAAGVLGTVVARALAETHTLVGLDIAAAPEPGLFTTWCDGSVADRAQVEALSQGCDAVVHLATGTAAGWSGLLEVDLDGTRNVLDAASRAGCRRVVITSSNHTNGAAELDHLAGLEVETVRPASSPRPDGLYGAVKVCVEALGRAAAECIGLPVSILRVGTVRLVDDPAAWYTSPDFAYIGDEAAVRDRLQRTWLFHPDLVVYVREELSATETYRVRYATSKPRQAMWDHRPAVWERPF